MIQNQRILFDDNGTENDLSLNLNNYRADSSVIPFVQGEDYLYIASDLPFNHRYFLVDVANDQASVPSVEIWDGSQWHPAVDVLDRTSTAGVTLAESGIIQWKLDRDYTWAREGDSEDVTDISKVGLYDMYWVRFDFSADLLDTTALKYLGFKFSDDSALFTYYPDLDNSDLMAAFASGKTDWDEQHFIAGEEIGRELKRRNIIKSLNQVLDYELFERASVHKTAEIIFRGLGRAYIENKDQARKDFVEAMNAKYYNIDRNSNANLDTDEKGVRTGHMRR